MSAEVILPRRVAPQPKPALVEGGDCGACVLGGLLGLSVEETYARFIVARFGKLQCFIWRDVRDALELAAFKGLADRAVTRTPIWPGDGEWQTWGLGGRNQWQAWVCYLRMGLDAGYYGVAGVDMDGRGPQALGPNHWVLICGWRPGQDGTVLDEILISCSARHPEGRWIRARDFLEQYGGYNVLLARPAR